MSTYKKPYLTFKQQLDLLKSRGLEVTNDSVALEYLRRLGYYRLSGYWYPCRRLIPSPVYRSKAVRPQREDNFLKDIVTYEIYEIDESGAIHFVEIVEVNKYAYKKNNPKE